MDTMKSAISRRAVMSLMAGAAAGSGLLPFSSAALAQGYPDRMASPEKTAIDAMFAAVPGEVAQPLRLQDAVVPALVVAVPLRRPVLNRRQPVC